jgi:myo-inositol-1(or 4)-monophosphatase
MYKQIIDKILELGDSLPSVAGNTEDIGVKKQHLTQKDIEIETELTKLISIFRGDHSVYAEELHENFVEQENVWIIDPISNTFNFIHGLPHYALVLSHMYKGEIIFAVVYDPSMKELFTAEKGKGAFLNGRNIKVSGNTSNNLEDITVLMGTHLTPTSPYREGTLKILEILSKVGSVRTFGSLGLHYSYVACGRADVAISFNKDTFPEFAGKLLVEEAGGKFTDFEGKGLVYNTHGIIASNRVVYEKIKEEIKKYA